jgi:hypothetical protein
MLGCDTLGTRLDVVEMLDGLMHGADRDLVAQPTPDLMSISASTGE